MVQHRFREQVHRGETKSPRPGEKPVRAGIFVVPPHKTNPAPSGGGIETRTRTCRSDGACGFLWVDVLQRCRAAGAAKTIKAGMVGTLALTPAPPLPSPRGDGESFAGSLECRALELAEESSSNQRTGDGCSFSWGEKAGMRASVKHFQGRARSRSIGTRCVAVHRCYHPCAIGYFERGWRQ